jgi:hypothetical protein
MTPTTTLSFTHVIAERDNVLSIIDYIHPATGRTAVNDETLEQVQARYPTAELVTWEAWRARKAAAQQTPVRWDEVSAEQYDEMLNVLPPIYGPQGFMVGEADDHDVATGRARYRAFIQVGGKYYRASRPMTRAEFHAGGVRP